MASFLTLAMMLAGCDFSGRDQASIGGYWKGQMVGMATDKRGNDPVVSGDARPRRILMLLEDSAGTVGGKFAQSVDMVAFRQLAEGSSRNVSTHEITGIRDGASIRLRFSSDDGDRFAIDARLDKDLISGTYSVRHGTADSSVGQLEKGTFEVKRY